MAKPTTPAPKPPKVHRPKVAVIELDSEGAAYLRTGKRKRRELTRGEFLELVARGQVIVNRTN